MASKAEDPTSKAAVKANAAADFGWSLTLLNSDPDLKKVFGSAVKNNWSAARFQAEVQNTNWFKKHSVTARQALISQTTDKATWDATITANNKVLKDHAASLGAVLTDKQLAKMTHDTTVLGWNDSQQQDAMAAYVKIANSGPNKGQYIGSAGKNAMDLKATALNNGYDLSDKNLGKWVTSIAAGDRTTQDFTDFARRQAALTFPSFADELYAGSDMKDLANPYITSMGKILEVDPDKIELSDPTLRKALASKDPKTGKPAAMAMYDFEDSLRQDNRWQYTDNAHDSVLGMGRNILQMFGKSI